MYRFITLEERRYTLTDIHTFRQQHNLPDTFGVALFEPKDYIGLASIEHAGVELNQVRQKVLDALPGKTTVPDLMAWLPQLTEHFRQALDAVNDRVKLKEVEIEYAVSGFDDVLQQFLYALIHSKHSDQPVEFQQVYYQWMEGATRVSTTIHPYNAWQVQIINNIYGRVGLIVNTGDETYYLRDVSLACPAEGFMFRLLRDVTGRINDALT